jgi:hypothetical protein
MGLPVAPHRGRDDQFCRDGAQPRGFQRHFGSRSKLSQSGYGHLRLRNRQLQGFIKGARETPHCIGVRLQKRRQREQRGAVQVEPVIRIAQRSSTASYIFRVARKEY